MEALLGKNEHGNLICEAGIMGVVIVGGIARADDAIRVTHSPSSGSDSSVKFNHVISSVFKTPCTAKQNLVMTW